jgi:hypothetical protein
MKCNSFPDFKKVKIREKRDRKMIYFVILCTAFRKLFFESYTIQHRAFVVSYLFIPTNTQPVQTLHREFCPNMSRYICAIFRESCAKLYVKFSIKP